MNVFRAGLVSWMVAGFTAAAVADDKPALAIAKAERLLWQGKTEDARETLEKLASKGDPAGLVALSHFYQRTGSLDDALGSAHKAVEAAALASPSLRSTSLVALANLTLRTGSGADALALARQAAEAEASPVALAVLARAYDRSGNHQAALDAAQQAVAADPKSMAAQAALGEALHGGGSGHAAVQALRKAIELKQNVGCTLCDAYVPEMVKVRLAAALVTQGITAEAMVLAQEAAEAHPLLGEAFAVLGMAILADNPRSWNEAIGQAQEGASLEPKNPVVQAVVGDIFAAGGNTAQAEASFAAALAVDPAYVPARVGLILVRVRQRDLDGALGLARELTRDFPDSGEAQLTLGQILVAKEDHAAAIEPLSKAADLLPVGLEPLSLLTASYRSLKQYDKAADTYARVVALAPDNTGYRTLYGLLLGLAGRFAPAVAELNEVVQTPDYSQAAAFINLGWVYRSMSPPELDESLAAYQRALELEPDNALAALGLGWTLSEAQDWDAAIAAFERAAQANGETAGEAYLAIARCHIQLQDTAAARVFLDKARQTGRDVSDLECRLDDYERRLGEAEARRRRHQAEMRRLKELTDRERQLISVMESTRASIADKIKATYELAQLSRARAVPALLWLASGDELDLQEAAVRALGSIGPAAREALPTLTHMLEDVPAPIINPTPEEAKRELRQSDVRRAARDAIAKIHPH